MTTLDYRRSIERKGIARKIREDVFEGVEIRKDDLKGRRLTKKGVNRGGTAARVMIREIAPKADK